MELVYLRHRIIVCPAMTHSIPEFYAGRQCGEINVRPEKKKTNKSDEKKKKEKNPRVPCVYRYGQTTY